MSRAVAQRFGLSRTPTWGTSDQFWNPSTCLAARRPLRDSWRPARQPIKVQGHDFPTPDVPRAYPYGIYDIGRNTALSMSAPITTPERLRSIRGWWRQEGRRIYPDARTILITADGGGSNGWRLRLWKFELQKFRRRNGPSCGLSFSTRHQQMEQDRTPLRTGAATELPIVQLIAKTTTAKGLKVTCRLDRRKYPTARSPTKK